MSARMPMCIGGAMLAPVSSDILKIAQGWRETFFKLGTDVQRSHAQRLQVLARGVDLSNCKQSHGTEGSCSRPCLGEVTQNKRDCCVQGLRLELELEVNCSAKVRCVSQLLARENYPQ